MQNDRVGLATGIKEPLCGWVFYQQHKYDIIPYEFELVTLGVRYKIKLKDDRPLKSVLKSLRQI